MTQILIIKTIDSFNSVKNKASKSILSEREIYLAKDKYYGPESKMAWRTDPDLMFRNPPNVRPLMCMNPLTGNYFKTLFEAKEFVSEMLLKLKCVDYKYELPHWQINLKKGKEPVFSYFEDNKIREKSLYIKFTLKEIYLSYMNFTGYSLMFQAFKPSDKKKTKMHKYNVINTNNSLKR